MNAVEDPETYYASVGIYVKNGSVFAPASSETKAGKDKVTAAFSGDRLAGATVGTMILNLDKGYTSQAMRMFRKNTDVNVRTFEDFGSMVDALRNDEIDAILYNTAFLKMMLEDGDDFFEWAAEADRIYIETENTATVKKADVVSEPFIVYLAGLDTDDEDTFRQSGTERADANILVCVDPVKKKILLVNTPRDYYVPLWGRNNAMDKLTHSGVYGIDCSVSTLESFYDIDINYYVRTNVFSLVKIVDALGGITVHSDFEFFCANGIGGYHHFYVGDNEIDGAAALCFIREREQFEDGDR